jgi:hypothetical protein
MAATSAAKTFDLAERIMMEITCRELGLYATR